MLLLQRSSRYWSRTPSLSPPRWSGNQTRYSVKKIVAFVELAGAPTPADVAAIAATASSALADYKVPEKVEVVEKLPRTAAGKIDRAALRGWARSADHTAELRIRHSRISGAG